MSDTENRDAPRTGDLKKSLNTLGTLKPGGKDKTTASVDGLSKLKGTGGGSGSGGSSDGGNSEGGKK